MDVPSSRRGLPRGIGWLVLTTSGVILSLDYMAVDGYIPISVHPSVFDLAVPRGHERPLPTRATASSAQDRSVASTSSSHVDSWTRGLVDSISHAPIVNSTRLLARFGFRPCIQRATEHRSSEPARFSLSRCLFWSISPTSQLHPIAYLTLLTL